VMLKLTLAVIAILACGVANGAQFPDRMCSVSATGTARSTFSGSATLDVQMKRVQDFVRYSFTLSGYPAATFLVRPDKTSSFFVSSKNDQCNVFSFYFPTSRFVFDRVEYGCDVFVCNTGNGGILEMFFDSRTQELKAENFMLEVDPVVKHQINITYTNVDYRFTNSEEDTFTLTNDQCPEAADAANAMTADCPKIIHPHFPGCSSFCMIEDGDIVVRMTTSAMFSDGEPFYLTVNATTEDISTEDISFVFRCDKRDENDLRKCMYVAKGMEIDPGSAFEPESDSGFGLRSYESSEESCYQGYMLPSSAMMLLSSEENEYFAPFEYVQEEPVGDMGETKYTNEDGDYVIIDSWRRYIEWHIEEDDYDLYYEYSAAHVADYVVSGCHQDKYDAPEDFCPAESSSMSHSSGSSQSQSSSPSGTSSTVPTSSTSPSSKPGALPLSVCSVTGTGKATADLGFMQSQYDFSMIRVGDFSRISIFQGDSGEVGAIVVRPDLGRGYFYLDPFSGCEEDVDPVLQSEYVFTGTEGDLDVYSFRGGDQYKLYLRHGDQMLVKEFFSINAQGFVVPVVLTYTGDVVTHSHEVDDLTFSITSQSGCPVAASPTTGALSSLLCGTPVPTPDVPVLSVVASSSLIIAPSLSLLILAVLLILF